MNQSGSVALSMEAMRGAPRPALLMTRAASARELMRIGIFPLHR